MVISPHPSTYVLAEPEWERYLDHATTSAPKAPGVADRVADALRGVCATPGRSAHAAARRSAELIGQARSRVAAFFGYPHPERVIFTSGATAAMNLAIKGVLKPGDHVVATSLDHNAALRPLIRLRSTGVRLTIVQGSRYSDLVAAVSREVRPQTRLIVVNHASNVLGCVLPYEPIAEVARAQGAMVLLDTAQTAGVIPIDLARAPVDLLVFSGHKGLLGPPGVGGLIVRAGLDLVPHVDGGTGHLSEELDPPHTYPASYEAGTPNTPAILGLDTAVEFLASAGPAIRQTVDAIRQRCVAQLRTLPGVAVFEEPDARQIPIVSFRIAGMSPHRIAAMLDSHCAIQVRAGLHCAPLVHQALGTGSSGGAVRASFGYGSTERSADLLCEAVQIIGRGV